MSMYSIYSETRAAKSNREIPTPPHFDDDEDDDGSHNNEIGNKNGKKAASSMSNIKKSAGQNTTQLQRPPEQERTNILYSKMDEGDYLVKEKYTEKGAKHVGGNEDEATKRKGRGIQEEPAHHHRQRRNQDLHPHIPVQQPAPAEIRSHHIDSARNRAQTLTAHEHTNSTTTRVNDEEEQQTPIDAYLAGSSSSSPQERRERRSLRRRNPDLVVEGQTETKSWYEQHPWIVMTGIVSCIILLVAALVIGLILGLNNGENNPTSSTLPSVESDEIADIETSQPSLMPSSSPAPTIVLGSADPTSSPTQLPTMSMAPTTVQFGLVEEQIAIEFPNMIDDDDESPRNGPRYKATIWMAMENDFDLPIPMNNTEDRRTFRERYALAVLYFSTNGNGSADSNTSVGGGWRDQCNFLSSSDVCNWQCTVPDIFIGSNTTNQQLFDEYEPYDDYFVNGAFSFVNPETSMGVFCNSDGAVTRLGFVSNNLHGTIPLEIGGLSSLTDLALPVNHLVGTVPFDVLGELLSNNAVPGGLRLAFNELSGTIPHGLRNDGLAYLTTMNLKYNQLEGTIPPQIFQLDLLTTLFLRSNMLTGNLPDTPPVWVLSLIDLTSNLLTSTLPSAWLSAGTINRLELSSNLFQGTIPDFPSTVPSRVMEFLELGDNSLSGTIPHSIGNLDGLWKIDLHENQLVGSLPVSMGSLTKLYELNVGNNSLTGDIGDFFSKSSLFGNGCIGASVLGCALGTLQMYGNEFSGSIPTDGFGANAMIVYLHSNKLSGRIPSELGTFSNLFKITLDDNQLTGPVPEEVGLLNLSQLTLQHNQLTGNLDSLCEASASEGYNWANNCFDLEINFGFEVDCAVRCECCSLCCDADGLCRENPLFF